MYMILAFKFTFNYWVSHYYLKRMEQDIERGHQYFEDNERFLKTVKQFSAHALKCEKYQRKCDEIKNIMCQKYPFLRKET